MLTSWQIVHKQESKDVLFDTGALDMEENSTPEEKKQADADASESDPGDVQSGSGKKYNKDKTNLPSDSFDGDSGSGGRAASSTTICQLSWRRRLFVTC